MVPAPPPPAPPVPPGRVTAVPPPPSVTVEPLPAPGGKADTLFSQPPVPPLAPTEPAIAALPPAAPPALLPPSVSRQLDRDEVRAALLVPLSGSYAPWGQALSNAAQLALFEVADQKLNLIPLDTRGTPEGAAEAARQALTQGADIILGPLFSPEVKAAGPIAREQRVPMIAFTTDRSAAGQGVYALGFLPDSQVSRVIGHARTQGKERFALLARSDEYGRSVAESFRAAVAAQGGKVAKVEFYDPSAADLTAVVKRFTEVESRTRGRPKDARAAKDLPPVPPPPFDAVMIPDDGTRLRQVASLISYYEVDPTDVRFLGTMLWADPRLASEPALQGGWFAAPPVAAHQDFEARYGRAFGPLPVQVGNLASIAYDATALVGALTRQNLDFSDATLTNAGGFAGIDGLFRLRPDGTNERGLAVREVARSGTKEIGPAPTSFFMPGQ
ncbi:putative ABC-type branched-chain amino acid transport systems, periplasmic component [Magnetospirillum sp. LM-5]|uniref:penicillin-binding protein activator n=1 Tax=Magnetospirillum sp. LM-5 TaxID=2681466 RepID=UPI00137CD274|nr:penicillin-binding protein activator [Magnetospirillum sp. LM-5]CAA7622884.1 putative ABC-type branched-chain amino acid transport systems, periplasmic component [Magnetospirillum sp. LM-5]